jgi:hypothetical protein
MFVIKNIDNRNFYELQSVLFELGYIWINDNGYGRKHYRNYNIEYYESILIKDNTIFLIDTIHINKDKDIKNCIQYDMNVFLRIIKIKKILK